MKRPTQTVGWVEPLRDPSSPTPPRLRRAGFRFALPVLQTIAAAVLCVAAPCAHAAWPNDKPIEIIVGYQAGSGPDILARRMAPVMAKHLGGKASFVINNRAGAAGEMALTAVSRAEPNGYTIGTLTTPSFIIIDLVKKPQYDPAAIVPLARVVDDPTLIAAGTASPIRDLRDLVARVKAAPGSVSIGHNGIATNGHLATLAIERVAAAKLNDIPFKGTSESRTALLGGHVDLVAMSVSEFVLDKEATGLFKALAQLGRVRAAALGEVPTARDLGFDIVISSERGFAAPRGVATDIMERLQKAIAAAVIDPDFLRGTTSDELAVSYLSGPDWTKSMAERRARYEAIWGTSQP
jgi:tripartite-type tricarboxylate transporter receptor subunit TctC